MIKDEIIDVKFNRLKVLKKDDEIYPNGDSKYICECDCGNIVKLRRYSITSGNTKSCGCFSTEEKKKRHWAGYKKLPKTVFNTIEKNAKIRNIEFLVTIEELGELFEKQGERCAVTGEDIRFGINTKSRRTASIDRIDNSKGYSIDNVRWVHVRVNQMKNDMTDKDLYFWCDKILNGLK